MSVLKAKLNKNIKIASHKSETKENGLKLTRKDMVPVQGLVTIRQYRTKTVNLKNSLNFFFKTSNFKVMKIIRNQ